MVSVSVGWDHSCAVGLENIAVLCWGGANWRSKGSGLGGLGEPTARVPGCINVCEQCFVDLSPAAPPGPGPASRRARVLAVALALLAPALAVR
jgi:hypothetical protein